MADTVISRYRDLDLSFIQHPVTKDIAVKTGSAAVIRAVRNLVLSSFYERPFHPELGSSVKQLLFENMTPLTAQYIKRAIQDVIVNHEPRVKLIDVVVQQGSRNGFSARIEFFIVSQTDPTSVTIFLERTR